MESAVSSTGAVLMGCRVSGDWQAQRCRNSQQSWLEMLREETVLTILRRMFLYQLESPQKSIAHRNLGSATCTVTPTKLECQIFGVSSELGLDDRSLP